MTTENAITNLPVIQLRADLASGEISAVQLAQACIDRITAREPDVGAWSWFDAEYVLQEAQRLDNHRASGAPLGPLHGLPVGVKDVIDTAGIPTENGCPVDAGRVPNGDAICVEKLKAAGAIMFGKTVTTELAFLHPGKTKNPINPDHTPGGSSSGSAAAVADGMIPLAIGTQTGGSVVRPASFCGITGFKPTFNAIPRDGVLMQSHSLDTVGVFASDPTGVAILAETLCDTAADKDFITASQTPPSGPPKLALVHPPEWDRADPSLHSAFAKLQSELGSAVTPTGLSDLFNDVAHLRAILNTAEMGHYYANYLARGADKLGAATRATIEEGLEITAPTYIAALERQSALTPALEPIFSAFDAILCPAALGPAPTGLSSTGDSIFNGLWTMAGTPAITLPLLTATNGLPMGAQLVGRKGEDAKLLSTARWLWNWAQTRNAA